MDLFLLLATPEREGWRTSHPEPESESQSARRRKLVTTLGL